MGRSCPDCNGRSVRRGRLTPYIRVSNVTEQTLIYEKSVPGRTGYSLPETSKAEHDIMARIPEKLRRKSDAALPEVAEPIVMRHYVNLSTKNHHIDKGFTRSDRVR